MKDFRWQTPEYVHVEKTSDWYWTVGIIAAALVIVSVIFGNALFGLVLAIGAFALTMFASRPPRVISVEISDRGIMIDKTLYPFPTLESFYVDEEHHHGPRLILKSRKVVMPLIAVPVALESEGERDGLRAFLSAHLKEEIFDQGILQTIFDRLGF
ncbi:MAG: hypothetical protein KGI79_01750 [Patescibacteria group bacterium]|nr:hypothetical protein [Patescibacteria group bacterium]MDE2116575.1 hypothetical protein [Patescibacteria group bacterium]